MNGRNSQDVVGEETATPTIRIQLLSPLLLACLVWPLATLYKSKQMALHGLKHI